MRRQPCGGTRRKPRNRVNQEQKAEGAWGRETSTVDEDLPEPEQAVLAVLYEPGCRPSIDGVRRAGEATGAFAVTFDPGDDGGWAELLITGLAIDVAGLAPRPGETAPPIAHRFGLADAWRGEGLEAVVVRPGANLAGAASMLPVVRGCVALASALAIGTGAAAVVWIPARSAMAPDYFMATVGDWLGGGAFPALGLTALFPEAAGIASEGLAFFTGQEIEVSGSDLAQAGRIAVRMIHTLIGHGPLAALTRLTGPEGEPLLAEPSGDGSRIRVTLQK